MKTIALSAALYAALSVAAPVPAAAAAGDCKSYVLLFARGTTEMGTMGTVVGPSLSTKVKAALGENNVNVEGVNYAADAGGIMTESVGTGGAGTTAMTNQANSWLTKCPDTKLILTGYSQGAMLVHHTTTKLGSKASKVAAAVTFGDPFKSQKLDGVDTSKFKTFCASGDSVCGMGTGSGASSGGTSSQSTSGHLGYGADTGTAANFIKSAVGSSSKRQLTGTSTTDGGLGGLSSLIPSSGSSLGSGTGSGLGGSLPSGLPSGIGSSTGSSLGGLYSGLPSLGSSGTATLDARAPQLSGLGDLGSLSSGGLSGLGSGTGTGSSLGGLSTPSFGSLGGSGSGTSPFGSLSSLGSGSLGSSGLGSSGLSSGF
ncbi:cutinase-domain-containing protein [Phyllosticta citrichinensis]|uniref:cutinase n=1 Tax=Phyllosticta citrichinensis TaxID=1130410 RepID=A0ABR1XI97_9PEZI